jgi:large subunit ribosomal protein L15
LQDIECRPDRPSERETATKEQGMNELTRLTPPKGGGVKERKRVGRGQASGTGKTAGRGGKGQKARTGNMNFIGFEGGQMPIQRRIPKRGFTNPFRVEYAIVNVGDLNDVEGQIDVDTLVASGRIKDPKDGLKILGDGELTKAVAVRASKVSASAREKIEKAGGKIELIEVVPKKTPQQRKAEEKAAAAKAKS